MPAAGRDAPVLSAHPSRRRCLAWGAASWLAAAGRPALAADSLDGVLADAERLQPMRSLVVMQHGELKLERAFGRFGTDALLPINSVTKSVASMLVGVALRDGLLPGVDETVARLLPDDARRWPDSPLLAVTLGQLLRGHSGVAYDFMRDMRALDGAADVVAYALALPAGPSGWIYNDAAVALLGPILNRACGGDLQAWAERELFKPLGIERWAWATDRQGVPLTWRGLQLRGRDVARLGAVMAAGGRWQGRALLPPPWVADSLRPHGPTDWRVAPVADPGYGYLWFTGLLHGQRVAWGWGYGAQFLMVVPALQLVVCSSTQEPPPQALPARNREVMALVARVVALHA
jgi:CubicO group peptidase (beta-lactamase class C family)